MLIVRMLFWLIRLRLRMTWSPQDEVRNLGRLPQLNVPEAFVARHPFPGAHSTGLSLPPTAEFHRGADMQRVHQVGYCIFTTQTWRLYPQASVPPAGPGLGVRVLGDVTAGDALEVLRKVRRAAPPHVCGTGGGRHTPANATLLATMSKPGASKMLQRIYAAAGGRNIHQHHPRVRLV